MTQHLVNPEFESLLHNNFDTENVSIFLYSVIRSCRPTKLLEIGAGYSTIFLAKALDDIKKQIKTEKEDDTFNFNYWKNYNPYIEVIENGSEDLDSGNSYKKLLTCLNEQNLLEYINFKHIDIFDYIELNETNINLEYDFVWIDFGTGGDNKRLFDFFFTKLSPGGYIIFHSTLTNLIGKYFISQMKLELKVRNDIEMISFWEPHKFTQNSFTVFRKVTEEPLFTETA